MVGGEEGGRESQQFGRKGGTPMSDSMQPPPAGPAATPPPPPRPLQPHRGTTILVLGILGLVCCLILGIIAWIMGNGDLREMNAGRMDPEGRGLTNAGRICGIISVCLAIVAVAFWVIMFVIGGAAALVPGLGR